MTDWGSYARQGQMYSAANVSAKSVIAVATAMTGVIIYNPIGSGVYLLLKEAGFAWTTAPAAVHNLGLAIGPSPVAPTSLTNIGSGVKTNTGLGNAGISSTGAYDAATFAVAPVAVRWFGGAVYGSGVGESPFSIVDNIDGAIALAPGTFGCLTVVTTTSVGLGHITWAEVPVVG